MVTEQDAETTTEKTDSPDETRRHGGLGSLTIEGDRAKLFEALAKAQANYRPIKRTRTVKVKSERGDYTFDYAPLEEVIDATLPALNEQGIAWVSFRADTEPGAADLHTLLTHSSGAFMHVLEKVPTNAVGRDGNAYPMKDQEFGSKLTYRRRYQYQCLTGSSAEFDDDGNASDGNRVEAVTQKPQRTPPAPPQKAPKDAFDKAKEIIGSLPKEAQATFKSEAEVASRPASVPPDAIINDEPISNEMIDRVKKAYAAKGFGAKAAIEHRTKVTGKTEGLTMADGVKVLQALEAG